MVAVVAESLSHTCQPYSDVYLYLGFQKSIISTKTINTIQLERGNQISELAAGEAEITVSSAAEKQGREDKEVSNIQHAGFET